MRTRVLPARTQAAVPAYPGSLIAAGSRGEYVRQIQQCLNNIAARFPDIPTLAEDSVFGSGTRGAVLVFQQIFGLRPDGLVGPATWNRMMQECARANGGDPAAAYPGYPLRVGASGRAVLQMQRYLNVIAGQYPALGIPRLAEDGKYGNRTRSAVIAFQQLYGLTADGVIGPATWNKITEAANASGETPGSNGDNGNGGSAPGELSADEREVFNLINQQRANNGLSALQIDPEVQKVARIKSQDMVDNNYFSHHSPTYGTPFQMLDRFGVSYQSAAENIAGNPRNSGAVTAWMNSSGHRTNILNGAYNYTGIGVVSDPRYGKIYTQMFIRK